MSSILQLSLPTKVGRSNTSERAAEVLDTFLPLPDEIAKAIQLVPLESMNRTWSRLWLSLCRWSWRNWW